MEDENNTLVILEKSPDNRILVPDKLNSPHPLIKMTEECFKSRDVDKYGRIDTKGLSCLDIQVSRPQSSRAIRIMDALIKALEKRGMNASVKNIKCPNTCLLIQEEELGIGIQENSIQRKHQLTKAELKDKHRFYTPTYDFEPSGQLSLIIKTYTMNPVQKIWKDRKLKKLEDCLNEILIGFIRASDEVKKDRLARERREKERKEQERLYEEMQRQKAEEEARFNRLKKQVDEWERSKSIRNFVDQVRSSAIEKHGEIKTGSELEKWLTWASMKAEQLDPLPRLLKMQDDLKL